MRTRGHSPLATRSRRRTNINPRLDALEERRLMAVAFVETALVAPAGETSSPYLVTHASDGATWTIAAEFTSNSTTYEVDRTDPQGNISIVPGLPAGDAPAALVAGDNGAVWVVTDAPGDTGHVVKLTSTYNVVGSLPVSPHFATLGADGDIWITASHSNGDQLYSIEKFNPHSGTVSSFDLPGGSTRLGPIVSASDGNLWTVEPYSNQLAKISTAGQVTEYSVGLSAWTIAAGTGGGVWVSGVNPIGDSVIAQVSPGGTAAIVMNLSQPILTADPHANASSLAAAPDGSLWFINQNESAIGHLQTTNGSLEYFPLPELGTQPASLTTDGGTGFEFTQRTTSEFVHLLPSAPDPSVLLTANSIEHLEGPLPAGITIARFTTTDATAFPFDFTARYQIGNQGPQIGTVLSDGNGGFVVQTTGPTTVQQPGSQFLSVTVLDSKHNNSIGVKSSGIGLVKIDEAPVTITGLDLSITDGVAFTGAVATLTDPDGGVTGDVPTQVTIDWGDGNSSSLTVAPQSSLGSPVVVPGGHVYTNTYPGNGYVTITANHGGTISRGTSNAFLTIPAISSLTPMIAGFSQGHQSEARVATFETVSPSVAANYWGYSTAPFGYARQTRIVEVGPTSFEVWATADFTSWGEQGFSVFVEPNSGRWSSVLGDTIVTPAPITATALPVIINSDLGVYGFSYGSVASFTSGNPQAQASDFRATITSGDGGTWSSSIHSDGIGGFLVNGEHKFPVTATAGTYAVTIKIDNVRSDGQVASAATLSENASVLPTPPLFGQTAGVAIQTPVDNGWVGTLGTFSRTNEAVANGTITATIHWGDGSPDSLGQIVGLSLYAGNEYAAFSVSGGHIFSRSGTFTPTIDIVAADGEHTTITSTVTVLPPPFVATGEALTGTQGTAISGVVATFRDATPSMPSAYAATIDWGDGTTSVGTVSTYQDAFVVFGSHVYATAGPHAYGVIMQKNGGTPVTTSGTVMVAAPKPVPAPAGGGPVGGSPMRIVSARSIRNKHGFIRVVVSVSGTVDAAAVSHVTQYVLTEPGKPGKHGTKDKIDTIKSAAYDPSTNTLTLVPRGTFRRPVAFRVALRGSAGVTTLAS